MRASDAVGPRQLGWLMFLVAVRALTPLAALVASGSQLPGFPEYEYDGPPGDAGGYISVARAIISAGAGLGPLLPLVVVVAALASFALRRAWRADPARREWIVAAAALLVACLASLVILRIEGQAPAGAVGWPLLLSVPLLPFRAVGWIDAEVAFGVGLACAIMANAVTVLATAFIGWRATGSRTAGSVAAALFAFWPFIVLLLLGEETWENGAWEVDTGLALYTEPLSTACVAVGLASLFVLGRPPWALVVSGIALGYATVTRPTNLVFVAAAAVLLASARDWPGLRRFVAGGAAMLPIALAFLPKKRGYDLELARDPSGEPLWSIDYVSSTFTDSSVWQPLLLAVLLPLVALGLVTMRTRTMGLVLLAGALANIAVYAFFRATPEHPRYLQAGLPGLLVLWSAGVVWLGGHTARLARGFRVRTS